MSKIVTAGETLVKYKGNYDWGALYQLAINWLLGRRYRVEEKRYKDKMTDAAGSEVEVQLRGKRKETPFIRKLMEVDFHLWGHKEVKGILNGKETMYTGGRISIHITAKVEIDWQNIFVGSKWKEVMGDFYFWVRKKEFELTVIDDHEYEALRLELEIKKFLKMETDTHAY